MTGFSIRQKKYSKQNIYTTEETHRILSLEDKVKVKFEQACV